MGQAAGNRVWAGGDWAVCGRSAGLEGLPGVIEPFCANSAVAGVSLQAWMETGGFAACKAGLVLCPYTCVSGGWKTTMCN